MKHPGSPYQPRKIPPWLCRGGISTCLVLLLTAAGLLSGCTEDQAGSGTTSSNQQVVANNLYDEAWSMINQEYVDGTFNGQDWNKWRDHYKGVLKDPDDAYVAIGTMG